MNRRGPLTNDLVIGMTLAEIFLLLLIVGWYGSRLESEEEGREPLTPAQVLAEELKAAKQELELQKQRSERLQSTVRELEGILDWLGQRLGAKRPIRDVPTAGGALGDYTAGLKRGKAVCDSENVLIHVIRDSERLTATIRHQFAVDGSTFTAGQTLDEPEIDRFLLAVQHYYSEQRATGRECAFDYTLAWRTDRDYRVAKRKFEPYFYPAGDRPLQ
jgi:hypothetical protein